MRAEAVERPEWETQDLSRSDTTADGSCDDWIPRVLRALARSWRGRHSGTAGQRPQPRRPAGDFPSRGAQGAGVESRAGYVCRRRALAADSRHADRLFARTAGDPTQSRWRLAGQSIAVEIRAAVLRPAPALDRSPECLQTRFSPTDRLPPPAPTRPSPHSPDQGHGSPHARATPSLGTRLARRVSRQADDGHESHTTTDERREQQLHSCTRAPTTGQPALLLLLLASDARTPAASLACAVRRLTPGATWCSPAGLPVCACVRVSRLASREQRILFRLFLSPSLVSLAAAAALHSPPVTRNFGSRQHTRRERAPVEHSFTHSTDLTRRSPSDQRPPRLRAILPSPSLPSPS